MREHAVERTRHAAEIERLDQRSGELDLPIRQEAAELLLGRSCTMRELLLVRAKRSQDPVCAENSLDDLSTKATHELVLQIGLADVEPKTLHLGATEVGTEAGPLERTLQLALLTRVA